jgi:hypothetical protein
VEDHGSVSELDEGLRESEGQRSQASAEATNEDESCRASEKPLLNIRGGRQSPFMFTVCGLSLFETGGGVEESVSRELAPNLLSDREKRV